MSDHNDYLYLIGVGQPRRISRKRMEELAEEMKKLCARFDIEVLPTTPQRLTDDMRALSEMPLPITFVSTPEGKTTLTLQWLKHRVDCGDSLVVLAPELDWSRCCPEPDPEPPPTRVNRVFVEIEELGKNRGVVLDVNPDQPLDLEDIQRRAREFYARHPECKQTLCTGEPLTSVSLKEAP